MIGITTTVPVEIIYAAGEIPVDINNIFIADPDALQRIQEAELAGFPRNVCGWIKGLYASAINQPEMERIIAVTQGDCSNTQALMETWEMQGKEMIPFAYPYDRDREMLQLQMAKLSERLGADWAQVEEQKQRLDRVRALAWEIDRLTWQEDRVSGFENHLYQVSCSDFNGAPEAFAEEMRAFIRRALHREPLSPDAVRLGFIGVPPIFPQIYDFLAEQGAHVVFNEVQRQFTMPFPHADLLEQYREYTYPYHIFARIADIRQQADLRRLAGIIHYTQSFCYRQIEDIIIRRQLPYPVLTVEGENPMGLDARTRMRLEAFVTMLRERA
ncbi:MAG: 2-hydroxyacyl-CoA dehydratase family protein [Peptococcaceae bacterium]|jgi:benzoyl-CoA reductase/2-hydroxyglutaryl-CoA dehydratase subunit BcrC/BadD/HgdB|nr:2-hydroxyacyl-CoA dehydratase family protein [Peptococcaceae bacterium]